MATKINDPIYASLDSLIYEECEGILGAESTEAFQKKTDNSSR